MSDPFPIPSEDQIAGGVDWDSMARSIVRDRLKVERNERVILCADPYYGGAMLDAIRAALQEAHAIELATILNWTPRLTRLRGADGCKPDPIEAQAEDEAMRDLFACADIYIWLQSDWRSTRSTYSVGQSEWVLAKWDGRGLHFHWFHDPNNPDPSAPVNKRLDRVYERAVLQLDYTALARDMRVLADSVAGQTIRIVNPAGTDLAF